MVRIVSDTSTMYSTAQAKAAGFDVSPLSVTINGQSYRELDEIQPDEFVQIIHQGHMPVSSQPAIGEVLELYERYAEDEIINISMADGLSGTYSTAVAAAGMCEDPSRITVINSRTLCGPHRLIVETAAKMAAQGMTRDQIVAAAETMMDTGKSFLLPEDFDYLRRGGRLSPLVSFVGKTIHLVPVLTQTADGTRLSMSAIKRNDKQAFAHLIKEFKAHGVGKGWLITITHGHAPDRAMKAKEALSAELAEVDFEVLPLTPVFITQGGPGCIAVQAVKRL